MNTVAVVLEAPNSLSVRALELLPAGPGDVVVEVDWSGISTGTEKLLWSGRMPSFPGMGYPLVPGYESVGRIVAAQGEAEARVGERVFVPGASCYRDARGLFGGTARRLIVPGARAIPVSEALAEQAALMALAATGFHATAGGAAADLIVGHGVLGRLLARLSVAAGGAPTVWETRSDRRSGGEGYDVVDPDDDDRRDYRTIIDASGDSGLLDTLVARLAKGGEVVLAGFYDAPLSLTFPPAFMREARIRVAAEFTPADLEATTALVESGALSLSGLISHVQPATDAASAYPQAFGDPDCLKMILDWRGCA